SFAHGSNDGQKGMGLIMLILIGIIPANYALRMSATDAQIKEFLVVAQTASTFVDKRVSGPPMDNAAATTDLSAYLKSKGTLQPSTYDALAAEIHIVIGKLTGITSMNQLPPDARSSLRSSLYLISESIGKLSRTGQLTDPGERAALLALRTKLDSF